MSLTVSGLGVLVLGMILQALGVPYLPEDLDKIVAHLVEIAGVIIAYIGRYRQGDINVAGVKH